MRSNIVHSKCNLARPPLTVMLKLLYAPLSDKIITTYFNYLFFYSVPSSYKSFSDCLTSRNPSSLKMHSMHCVPSICNKRVLLCSNIYIFMLPFSYILLYTSTSQHLAFSGNPKTFCFSYYK